ncbi:MAG: tRNA pseudouridine synthase A [Phycisphaerales bacterium]
MPRYKLTIAYDGTNFCGWQKQEPFRDRTALAGGQQADAIYTPSSHDKMPVVPAEKIAGELGVREGEDRARVALRTVQHVVEQAVRVVVRERVNLDGASRTDTGVHARGQVGAFTCSGRDEGTEGQEGGAENPHSGWPLSRSVERLVRALNGNLPEDVVVMGAEVVHEQFNPVGDATSKAYSYTIHNARERAMWDRNYVHHVYEPLDVAAMQQAAAHFVGEQDFVAFAAANHGRLTTVRTVFSCGVTATPIGGMHAGMPQRVRIDISGSGFLYNMVRIISGTLVEVGRGRIKPDAVPGIITGKDRRAAGPTLPGRGLCLEWIRYQ